MFGDNYPELLHTTIIIKGTCIDHMTITCIYIAPRIFPMAFNLIKPYIDQKTQDKIVIMGGSV